MLLPYANLQVKHWNEGATAPLILPVHVVCNTSDEVLHENIRINSRRPGQWLKQLPEHSGVAVMCGSGPSLAEGIERIERHRANGDTIFAMNGSAKFLADQGVMADVQLMIDPRPQTAQLVGPAYQHWFASQVHPDCFAMAPDAMVWHLQIEGIDDLLPDYEDDFTLVGGAASVGNSGAIVAFAMGYRTLHFYGYDSSHRGHQSHAFRQPMNDGEPCAKVTFNHKDYMTSLTMKLQAERFMETGKLLEGEGCKIFVHGDGLLPDMWNTPMEDLPEREKYERMWTYSAYRKRSPGEESVETFLETVKPSGLVVDFGCGTGRAGAAIAKAGYEVILVDFASNCRDQEVCHLPFYELDLAEPMPLRVPYGFCADVMEHIAPDKVETVIRNIMATARVVFFQISTREDSAGAIIHQTLHLTVQPHSWWRGLFDRLGYAIGFEHEVDDTSQFVISRKDA